MSVWIMAIVADIGKMSIDFQTADAYHIFGTAWTGASAVDNQSPVNGTSSRATSTGHLLDQLGHKLMKGCATRIGKHLGCRNGA